MIHTPIPILEPLIESILELSIGEFLLSKEFKRYLSSINLDYFWREEYEYVERKRVFVSASIEDKKTNSIDVFISTCNSYYSPDSDELFVLIKSFLFAFHNWEKEEIKLEEVIKDLKLLGAPDNIIQELDKKNNSLSAKPVENTEIHKGIYNSIKLEASILKMEKTILNGEYNLTLTYAYSCLEGLFKAYIHSNISEISQESDLAKLSKLVKKDLVEYFIESKMQYPEKVIDLIGTITNAVSNARNSFSESHFDNDSDKWLAEFVKDCVNSIGRLILKFIK
tara:strand:- start:40 stop:882 length:843 start_codon:yes stop_codon:yes gene_type:complete